MKVDFSLKALVLVLASTMVSFQAFADPCTQYRDSNGNSSCGNFYPQVNDGTTIPMPIGTALTLAGTLVFKQGSNARSFNTSQDYDGNYYQCTLTREKQVNAGSILRLVENHVLTVVGDSSDYMTVFMTAANGDLFDFRCSQISHVGYAYPVIPSSDEISAVWGLELTMNPPPAHFIDESFNPNGLFSGVSPSTSLITPAAYTGLRSPTQAPVGGVSGNETSSVKAVGLR